MPSKEDLKNLAKERGFRNYQNKKKKDLAELLNIQLSPQKKYFKNLAKERGFRNYQNKKKADLVKLLKPIPAPRKKRPIPAPRKKRPIPAPRVILNIKNPEINFPVLKPEIAVIQEKQAPTFIEKSIQTFSDWINWLKESGKKYIVKPVSLALKNLKEKITKLVDETPIPPPRKFKVTSGPSALQNFIREFDIKGKAGYDTQSFFEETRNLILKILNENKNTKVKMILLVTMQKKTI